MFTPENKRSACMQTSTCMALIRTDNITDAVHNEVAEKQATSCEMYQSDKTKKIFAFLRRIRVGSN